MKFFTFLLFSLFSAALFAQNYSLTIFNNSGQQFFVIMNGIRQNSIPQTNVKIAGITAGSYEVKLIFADGKTGDINKKIFFSEPGDYLARVVFKGSKRKLQYFGVANETQAIPSGSTSVSYRPNDQSTYSDQQIIPTQSTSPNSPVVTPTQQSVPANSGMPNGTVPANTNSNGAATIGNNGTSNVSYSIPASGSGNANTTINNASTNGSVGIQTTVVPTNTSGNTTNTTTGNVQMNSSSSQSTNANGATGIQMNVSVSDPTMGNVGGSQTTSINTNTVNSSVNSSGSSTSQTVGGVGFQMNVSISDPTMGVNQSTQNGNTGMVNATVNVPSGTMNSSATTSTTNASTTIQNGQVINDSYQYQQTTTITQNGQTTQTTTSNATGSAINGSMNTASNVSLPSTTYSGTCSHVLMNTDQFVNALLEESFENDRVAKVQTDLNAMCVTSNQAHQIVEVFSFDNDKLTVAKFLYDRMTDKNNGGILLDLFAFETDQTQLKAYMSSHH